MTSVMSRRTGPGHNRPMSTTASTHEAAEPAISRTGGLFRAVALPVEHGGWSFLLEPLILGLILVPSAAGVWVAMGAVAAFLARQPLKLLALNRRRGGRYPRTGLSERFFAVYALAAAVSLAAALRESDLSILTPLILAAPFAVVGLRRDFQGRGREALPEIAAGLALGASATIIILAGRGSAGMAWLAWALLAGRAITAVLYVRARVRIDRSDARATRFARARPVLLAHASTLLLALWAAGAGRAPALAAAAFALLFGRAVYGLAPGQRAIRPQVLGVQEVIVGLACLCLFTLGLSAGR